MIQLGPAHSVGVIGSYPDFFTGECDQKYSVKGLV